jgi:hypothetical protein
MKSIITLFIILSVIITCKSNTGQPKINVVKKDSVSAQNNFTILDSIEAAGQRIRDTNYTYLNKILDSAIVLAQKKGFANPFTATIDTSAFAFKNLYATIEFGHIFSSDRWHLVIKRRINEYEDYDTSLYSDIYLVKNRSVLKVVADTCDDASAENYLEDVNHDGYKDYIVYSYSSAGCCPRNDETAYLYDHVTGRFVFDSFFNREAGSSAYTFYETSYGLGDFINLYKYKWSGLRKVMLEEIYQTKVSEKKRGITPVTYTRVFYPSGKKQILKHLPPEYKRLKMADYIGEGEN